MIKAPILGFRVQELGLSLRVGVLGLSAQTLAFWISGVVKLPKERFLTLQLL